MIDLCLLFNALEFIDGGRYVGKSLAMAVVKAEVVGCIISGDNVCGVITKQEELL